MTPRRNRSGGVGGTIAVALLAALLSVPASAAAAGGSSPLFGVNVQTYPSGAEFEAMREGGIATYRWTISWPGVQPEPESPPNWTAIDPVMANLAENGVEALPVLYGSPCFVVPCRSGDPQPSPRPPIDSTEARVGWATFLRELVGRYGPGGSFWSENPSLPERPIRLWQIWNEPNAPQFYRPAPSALEYAELLELSSKAIRSVDSKATIMLGGLPGNPHQPGSIDGPRFLDELYRLGAQRHFDAVAVHPYSANLAGVRNQVAAARLVIAGHDDTDTPIWVTELGWGADPDGEGRLIQTVDGQAEMLRRSFGLVAARRAEWNVGGVLWYAWRDPPRGQPACEWCRTAGLLAADGNPRPSWTAFAELSGGTPVSPGELPGNGGLDDDGAGDGAPGGESAGDGGRLPILALIAAAAALAGAAAAWLARRRATKR
jgi:polysaccharide biosynthesis protein PslG